MYPPIIKLNLQMISAWFHIYKMTVMREKSFVIGIAGGSASGKSTLTEALVEKLREVDLFVIHMDHYYKPEGQLPVSKAPVKGIMYTDYNIPLSFDLPLIKHDLDKAVASGRYKVIIIEGVFALWDQNISENLNLKVFIDCKADERIVRRLKRNMDEWGHSFDQISEVYLDLVRYRHDEYVEPSKWQADIILNGSSPSAKSSDILTTYINHLLANRHHSLTV